MVRCPNGCTVSIDAIAHVCRAHQHAIENGNTKFKCKISKCKLAQPHNKEKGQE